MAHPDAMPGSKPARTPCPVQPGQLLLSSADASSVAQVFGRLQSKLFPLYFMLSIACLVLQLGTLAFGPGSGLAQQQLVTLGVWQFADSIPHTIDSARHTC